MPTIDSLRRLLIRLCKACRILPNSVFLTGVVRTDRDPSAAGGYADIFKGQFGGQTVALKRLRVASYPKETVENLVSLVRIPPYPASDFSR